MLSVTRVPALSRVAVPLLTGAREEGPYQSDPTSSTKIKRETPESGSRLNFFFVC
jgi:hypothetical protein